MIDGTTAGQLVAGLVALLGAGRYYVSWWKKQGGNDNVEDKTQKLIDRLHDEVNRLETRCDQLLKDHNDMARIISELERQNALLLMLVRLRGVTEEELIAAKIIPPPAEVKSDGQ